MKEIRRMWFVAPVTRIHVLETIDVLNPPKKILEVARFEVTGEDKLAILEEAAAKVAFNRLWHAWSSS